MPRSTPTLPHAGCTFVHPAEHPQAEPVRTWAAHVDAGRIGTRPPPNPDALAILHATDALFRSFRNPRSVWERGA
ncbi:hypothetical protein SAMN05192583_1345 [Sphingomonas gellani]|uniref:Uncharacterized protein n=1 Tax=Sphingomonas gellani TaxID=1166340 RepID=A0A1H8BFP2_9SPHN|nr:hypothetical protein [Sphingomonas gellani]SEM81566.1 hypothetical protein SAMN05192583_1345 [Sphingomonas gellani]